MSSSVADIRSVDRSRVPQQTEAVEALYTICPVLTAANVAVELGWLDEEFERVGGKATYLRSLDNNAGWIPHYTHGFPNLFRDGGAIPTIKAKADLTETKLIGLTWGQSGGQIVVRSTSGIRRVADLKGRKIGLFNSLNRKKIDFARITAHRGILLALELAGLGPRDVEIVDIDEEDAPEFKVARKPSALWAQREPNARRDLEVRALAQGAIDAIYSQPGRSFELVQSGEYTIIEDLSRYPDWTLSVANGPYTIAVSAEFAERHPELVVAYLRASVRAGRWVNRHRAAAAEIFTRVTFNKNNELVERLLEGADLVPSLSTKNLAALELQKKFLVEHGYIDKDFDVLSWADSSYLERALDSL